MFGLLAYYSKDEINKMYLVAVKGNEYGFFGGPGTEVFVYGEDGFYIPGIETTSSLKFHSWRVVNDFGEFEKILKQKEYSYHIDGLNLIVNDEGNIYLNFLTSLPKNIQFNNGGYVDLDSLTSLPENIQFNNRGDVELSSLLSLPENKYEIFKNRGTVIYDVEGDQCKEFKPYTREA